MTSIDILRIRKELGRKTWGVPTPFGPDGWRMDNLRTDDLAPRARIIITAGPSFDPDFDTDVDWLHASMSKSDGVPTYQELVDLHRAVWGDGWAYHVFAPSADHVNIHATALHLWGRPDGRKLLPNFGVMGSI